MRMSLGRALRRSSPPPSESFGHLAASLCSIWVREGGIQCGELNARPGRPGVPHVRPAQGPKFLEAPNFDSPFSYNANSRKISCITAGWAF
jgi:hypothetical protein